MVQAYSSADSVQFLPGYYVARAKDLVLVVTGLVAGVGLVFTCRLGWWAALCHCYWRLALSSILPIAGVLTICMQSPENASPAAEQFFWDAGMAAALFLLIALYLNKKSVTAWYDTTPYRGIAINVFLLVGFVLLATFFDSLVCSAQTPVIDP